MTTRKQVYIILFSISLILALLGLSVVITLSAINQSFYTNINITYTATNNIILNFANNEGTSINIDETSVVYSDDGSQFRIDGEVPTTSTLTRSGEVTNLDNLTNNNGAEFYYFSTNSNVLTNPQNTIWEEQIRYYVSTEEAPIWYDAPDEITNLYTTFLTPNCYTGTQEDIGSNTDIIFSHQVTTIPYNAFSDAMMTGSVANITSIVIPNSVINIESETDMVTGVMGGAFLMCMSLTNAIIPSSVEHISDMAFMMCTGLASNTYDSGKYIGIEGNPYALLVSVTDYTISSIDIHDECISIQGGAFVDMMTGEGCQNLTSVSIPSKVKNIGYGAFIQYTNLNSITFEEGSMLEEIGMVAFGMSGIKSINIPSSVKSIGMQAFAKCPNLTSILFEEGSTLEEIRMGAFAMTGISSFTIPKSVKVIESGVFMQCLNLTRLEVEEGNEYFVINGNCLIGLQTGMLIQGFNNSVIPDDGSVTSIGVEAFYNCSSLESITIPSSVTSIGDRAFYNCNNLFIYFEDDSNFSGDLEIFEGVKGLEIPDTIIEIPDSCFQRWTNLQSIIIPSSVISIGSSAFEYCSSLESITIPSSVISIGNSAFRDCSNLTGDLVIPEGVTSIGNYTFYGCSSLNGTLTLPSTLTSIGEAVFEDCSNLTGDLVIPEGITSIGYSAFRYCSSLTGNLVIPEGVTSIGDRAFYNCSSLNGTLSLPSTLTSIGNYTFYGCRSLTGNLVIPEGITSIGTSAFDGCRSLTGNLVIPEGVTSIGYSAFGDCSGFNGTFSLPSTLTSIGDEAFISCSNLTGNLVIPEGVTSIGESAFEDCSSLNGTLSLPSTLTSIGSSAFSRCSSLTGNLVIPEGVTSIGSSAFYNCSSLNGTLSLPSTLTSIGKHIFSGCSSLTGNLVIPEGVTSIGSFAFEDCSSLTGNLVIPEGVTGIGDRAFSGCSSLNGTLTLPSTLTTSIGAMTFSGCSNLTGNLVIPEGVTSIGQYAFSGCRSLVSIVIPESVTSIGDRAFSNCYKLVEVYNLSSLNITAGSSDYGNVGYYALDIYTSLEEETKLNYREDGYIMYEDSENNRYYLVGYNGNEKALELPTTSYNYEINEYAFYENKNITSVTIPNCVTNIGSSAFYGCNKLVEIYNLSSLNIIARSSSYGYVGYYALDIYTSLEEETKLNYREDGYIMYEDSENNRYYLMGYTGNEKALELPTTSYNYEIYDYAFYDNKNITSVTIPNCVTSIGSYAFYDCNNLESITIPSSVTSIGDMAFYYCRSLVSIVVPESVTSIGNSAFRNCSNLTIYCEVVSEPSGWSSRWNYSNRPVYWGGEWEYDGEGNPVPIDSVSANSLLVNANSTIYKSEDLDIVFIDRKKSA